MRGKSWLLTSKRARRRIEYFLLIAFQFALTFGFRSVLDLWYGGACLVAGFSLAMILARYRERRRAMDVNSRARVLADASEALTLLLVVTLFAILGLQVGVPLIPLQAHLCLAIGAYFAGSFLGEFLWFEREYARLDARQSRNYIYNLNASMIFPYDIRHILASLRMGPSSATRGRKQK